MTTPLLKTKLYIPQVQPTFVARPRLVARLDEAVARGCALVLLSAPAGFGKTTLLSEWIRRSARRPPEDAPPGAVTAPLRVGWVSLDAGDDDPLRFLEYVLAALRAAAPEGEAEPERGALAKLHSPALETARALADLEPALTDLVNALADLAAPVVLVLDDYHTLQAPLIHESVAYLLEHAPPQVCLVLSTRADPPLPLSRLRGRGQVVELRQADLRFSPDEAAALLGGYAGLDLAGDEIAALAERTEGWAAGLQLAALALQGPSAQGGPDRRAWIAALSGSHRYILDYLLQEVLDRQPAALHAFLLQTSILERMCASLCEAVLATPGSDGQALLDRLDRANLFVVPLDAERRWFRYHHLFADLLRQRLAQADPDRAPELHRRASAWYEQRGLIADAIGHALRAGDVERVARLVQGNTLVVMDQGDLRALVRQLGALAPSPAKASPWLSVAQAWALAYAGQLNAAGPLLAAAQARIEAPGSVGDEDTSRRVAARIAFLRSYIAMNQGQGRQAVDLAREALADLPADEAELRAYALSQLGAALVGRGELAEAARAHREAIALCDAPGGSHVAVMVLCRLARIESMRGQLARAAASCREALRHAEAYQQQTGRPLPAQGYALLRLGGLLYEWNDLEGALQHVQEGLARSAQWGQADILALGHSTLARILRAAGDVEGAKREIARAGQIMRGLSHRAWVSITAWEARLQLGQGNVQAASRWAQESGLGVDDAIAFYDLDAYRTLARVLASENQFASSLSLLGRLLEIAERAGAVSHVVETRVVQALVLQAQGEGDRALDTFMHAIAPAEPEGYVRTFVDEGAPMARLLHAAQAQRISTGYTNTLLAALADEPRGEETGFLPRRAGIEPLSERELEVLRLLPTHLSRPEIAERLYVSPNTVRFHLKNIYHKLGVHSRADAIQRARDLDLL